jgi:hypothetical protein
MSNDPAFLFYPKDWISSVAGLTLNERGQYITLLCLEHQNGRLKQKDIDLAFNEPVTEDVMAKFVKDDNGLFYNVRLEKEMKKRADHAEKQRQRAIDGWKKRKETNPDESQGEAAAETTANAAAMPLVNGDVIVNSDSEGNLNKGGVGEKPKPNPVNNVKLPWPREQFSEHWARWLKYKKDQHKFTYKSQESHQIALNELKKISDGNMTTAIDIINHSIANGYKGLFPIKKSFSNGNPTNVDTKTVHNGAEFGQL